MKRDYAPLYIALIHHPVLNKHGEVVTTSITNFDIHDLARTSRTYGVDTCFLVTPNEAQQKMIHFIKEYWRQGYGSEYNPDRKEAFEPLQIAENLEQTCLTIEKRHAIRPKLIATTARITEKSIKFSMLKEELFGAHQPYLLCFGTGWGLASSLMKQMDAVLEPIQGPTSYNHLPVRAAVAIILDRLLGC